MTCLANPGANGVSPTIFTASGFRFYFFSREERRMHVHVWSPDGEAKFWLEPDIALAHNHGLAAHRLRRAQDLVNEHASEICLAWKTHFGG